MTREIPPCPGPTRDNEKTPSLEIADREIKFLLKRLDDQHVCRCCTAQELALHAAGLAVCERGHGEAILLFEKILRDLREMHSDESRRRSTLS